MQSHDEALSDIERYISNNKDITLSEREHQFDNWMRYLRPFKTVDASVNMLEVGTGMGWGPIIAKKRGLRLQGLEISPVLAEAGREYGRRYGVDPDIIVGNVETYDLGSNVYDVVIASSVFEHVEHWRTALVQLHRSLKPGGALFFESTNKFSITSAEYPRMPFYGWLPNAVRYRLRMTMQGPDIMKNGIDFHQFTYRGLRRAFREVGFSESHDRAMLVDPDEVKSGLRRNVLRLCKRNAVLSEIMLTFFECTTFVCIK
jgi:SAM-dependent methyltransferase